MGLKFRSKNTQMKQKKRFLCGNNGNSLSFRSKTNLEESAYLTEYQHQTRDRKFEHPFCSLYDLSSTYKCNFLGADNKQ